MSLYNGFNEVNLTNCLKDIFNLFCVKKSYRFIFSYKGGSRKSYATYLKRVSKNQINIYYEKN